MLQLNDFIQEHINKEPKAMNVEFLRFAREHNLELTIGDNDYWGLTPEEEEQVQALEVNNNFVQTLALFGAKMEPSLEEINQFIQIQKDEVPYVGNIKIISNNNTYEGVAYLGILSKSLSVWMDTNNLKQI